MKPTLVVILLQAALANLTSTDEIIGEELPGKILVFGLMLAISLKLFCIRGVTSVEAEAQKAIVGVERFRTLVGARKEKLDAFYQTCRCPGRKGFLEEFFKLRGKVFQAKNLCRKISASRCSSSWKRTGQFSTVTRAWQTPGRELSPPAVAGLLMIKAST